MTETSMGGWQCHRCKEWCRAGEIHVCVSFDANAMILSKLDEVILKLDKIELVVNKLKTIGM